jgi:hypothetical protein
MIAEQYRQLTADVPASGPEITVDDMISAIINHEIRETHSVL